MGIRTALHPMADLATEPRWGRINGTFGEDAELSARLIEAYIRGFQGETLGPHSVACMTKHFPGGGPQKDGEDPHFPEGKEQVYPANNFDYHLIPFEAAFRAGTAQIMPYYGQPIGLPGIEEVGFGFNKDVITGLLREKYGFDGVVCTDWGLLTSAVLPGGTGLRGQGLGRRASEPGAARAEGAERRRGSVRRRGVPGGDRRAGAERPGDPRRASTSRCAACCAISSGSACSTILISISTPPNASPATRTFGRRANWRSANRSCCSRMVRSPAERRCPFAAGRASTSRESIRRSPPRMAK